MSSKCLLQYLFKLGFFYMNGCKTGKTNKEKRWEDGEMKEERKA